MAKIYATDASSGRNFVIAEVCGRCYDEAQQNGMSEAEIASTMDNNGEERFSYGITAGYWCDDHWRKSGYKGSTSETEDEQFDPDYAGERMDPDD